MNISRFRMPRPGQLLALCTLALLLGVLVFAILPDGLERLQVAAWKAWLLSCFVALGLAVDQIVFWYARPGKFLPLRGAGLVIEWSPCTRMLFVHSMYRRAIIIGSITLAGGLAL